MQVVVIFVRSITPFSYIYLTALLLVTVVYPRAKGLGFIPRLESSNFIENMNEFIFRQDICTFSKQNILFSALTVYCVVEAVFFCYYYYLFTQLNDNKNDLDHFASTPEKRKKLVENCFEVCSFPSPRVPGSCSWLVFLRLRDFLLVMSHASYSRRWLYRAQPRAARRARTWTPRSTFAASSRAGS